MFIRFTPYCAGVWPGKVNLEWSAWEVWCMGRRVKVATVLGWFFSVNGFGHGAVPRLRVPQESTYLLFCGTHQHCCCIQSFLP